MSTPPMAVLSFGNVQPPAQADLPGFPTVVLPTEQLPGQQGPSSSQASSSSVGGSSIDLQHVARSVLKAKRVAVVCGAGISTASGIPDFRSGAGLFKSLKEQYPDARLSSGKDLFDVGLFANESNTAIFYNMIAELKKQADAVEPTPFHAWLKELDDEGKLFRVYTQNIDALEEKAGLSYGLGDPSLPLPSRRQSRSPAKPRASTSVSSTRAPTPSSSALQPTSSQASADTSSSYPTPRPSPSPPPPTHATIPRVIPLHGHLSTLSCSACKHVAPTSSHLPLLASGAAPICPACTETETARTAAGGRSRGVGLLRPDVVLYGEEHKDGERVGEITRRDLLGARPDLLIVVGTTLKVKGTKRLVRELAKVTKPPMKENDPSSSASQGSAAGGGRKRGREKPPPVHTLYLNYDFPTPSRDWQGLFDVWARGDIQSFVAALKAEKEVLRAEGAERERKRAARMSSSGSGSGGGSSTASAASRGGVKNGMGRGTASRPAGTTAEPPRPFNKFHVEIPPRKAPTPRGVVLPVPMQTAVPPASFHARASTNAGKPLMPFSLPPLTRLPPLPTGEDQGKDKEPELQGEKRSPEPSPARALSPPPSVEEQHEEEEGHASDSSLSELSDSDGESELDDEDEPDIVPPRKGVSRASSAASASASDAPRRRSARYSIGPLAPSSRSTSASASASPSASVELASADALKSRRRSLTPATTRNGGKNGQSQKLSFGATKKTVAGATGRKSPPGRKDPAVRGANAADSKRSDARAGRRTSARLSAGGSGAGAGGRKRK
ncbi:hypothetical protein JCM10213_008203 [Rhodosporidiobolus nylandii]